MEGEGGNKTWPTNAAPRLQPTDRKQMAYVCSFTNAGAIRCDLPISLWRPPLTHGLLPGGNAPTITEP